MLRRPVDLEAFSLTMIELFWDFEPGFVSEPLHNFLQVFLFRGEPFLLLGWLPVVSEAHPLEHGLFVVFAGDELGDILPIIFILNKQRSYIVVGILAVFVDQPEQNYDILLTPVFLDFFVDIHSESEMYYFLIELSASSRISLFVFTCNDLGSIIFWSYFFKSRKYA